MRKIVSGMFISLDGVVDGLEVWHFPLFNDEMGHVIDAMVSQADAALFGRKTFEEFAGYWPNHEGDDKDFADFINGIQKYVVSSSLESTDWQNSTILSGDLKEEITALKQLPGKNINMTGSGTLVRGLLRENLLDELQLLVHPVLAGSGMRLFDGLDVQRNLTLVEARPLSNGVLHLTYRASE